MLASVQHHGVVPAMTTFRGAAVAALALSLAVGCSTTETVSGTDPAGSDDIVSIESAATDVSTPESGSVISDTISGGAASADAVLGDAVLGDAVFGEANVENSSVASSQGEDSAAATSEPPAAPVTVVPLSGWAAVDQYLEATIVRGGSSAASVAVLRSGELQHQAAYGERVADDPAEPTDRFRVASISKTILAITALDLVEDGVLGLDDPVGGQLASGLDVGAPTGGTGAITVRQLLTHRSGFPQYENLFFRNEVGSCADAARQGLTRPLQSVPGTSFQYSNMNFCALGLLIEQVTGAPYSQVVQEQVLAPLGITAMRTAATFDLEPGDVEHESDAGRNYMEVLGGAGAWLAAPTDLVTILDSLDPLTPGTKLLEPAMLQLMATITETPPTPADDEAIVDPASAAVASTTTIEPLPPTRGYGLGLMIFDQPLDTGLGAATFGHTGTLESTHAMFVRRPDGLTWAITVSGDYPGSTRALATIMDNALVLGGFVDGTYITPPPPLSTG
jgi:D-alanyl-D-alanine carboxypeptidase